MKRVRVLIPFKDGATGTVLEAGKEVELADETIAKAKAININMLLVLGEAEEKAPKKPRAKKETE